MEDGCPGTVPYSEPAAFVFSRATVPVTRFGTFGLSSRLTSASSSSSDGFAGAGVVVLDAEPLPHAARSVADVITNP
jgi:anthranilate phosphoribosyltransferase